MTIKRKPWMPPWSRDRKGHDEGIAEIKQIWAAHPDTTEWPWEGWPAEDEETATESKD